jgi:diadenosine tetraphosphate (Ap4A) HIT family hydrolase
LKANAQQMKGQRLYQILGAALEDQDENYEREMHAKNEAASDCIFCDILRTHERPLIAENELFFVISDRYPVSRGHALVIPKRHVTNLLDLAAEEMIALHSILGLSKQRLALEFRPDGYNIGINEGEAAGQTVRHLHIHVIPRYAGDVDDPRGGIRNLKKALVPY